MFTLDADIQYMILDYVLYLSRHEAHLLMVN
jgi:hypothetical protein